MIDSPAIAAARWSRSSARSALGGGSHPCIGTRLSSHATRPTRAAVGHRRAASFRSPGSPASAAAGPSTGKPGRQPKQSRAPATAADESPCHEVPPGPAARPPVPGELATTRPAPVDVTRKPPRVPEAKDVALVARRQERAVGRPGQPPGVFLLERETRYFLARLRVPDPNCFVTRPRRPASGHPVTTTPNRP